MPNTQSGSGGRVPAAQGRANPEGGLDQRELARDLQNTIAAIRIEAPFFAHIITGARLKFRALPVGFAAASRGKRSTSSLGWAYGVQASQKARPTSGIR